MALIAVAIKLETHGPVLFSQRRRGLNLAVIDVLKFRTMRVMEDGDHVEQAHEADPRVTKVGRILRRTSLDELPQLINVLKGEMSLVGPRPHALAHDEQWGEHGFDLRHSPSDEARHHRPRPGRGLARRGHQRRTTSQRASPQDLAYIRNWSLGLDLAILVRTLGAVVCGKNAH